LSFFVVIVVLIPCRVYVLQQPADTINDGPGISPEVAQQIFIPFFTTKPSGSGIGLSLSRALLQVQDAQLEYVPGEAPGSCFSIRFTQ
jgi:two-component system, NtrC family, nitrogen regulation sensor histidine kinase NtrY